MKTDPVLLARCVEHLSRPGTWMDSDQIVDLLSVVLEQWVIDPSARDILQSARVTIQDVIDDDRREIQWVADCAQRRYAGCAELDRATSKVYGRVA